MGLPGAASAQVEAQDVPDEANRTRPYIAPSLLSAQARFGQLGEDWYFTAIFRLNYNQEDWGLGLQLPFRIRLKDNDPKSEALGGFLRKQDWDQPGDFLKLLQYVYIGRPDKEGPYFLQAGDLTNLTLGHGTVMHRYFNNTDISRWRTGINAAANIEGFSVDAVVGDIISPYLTGLRAGIRPLRMHRGFQHAWYDRFEIGATFFADWVAPFALERDPGAGPGMPGPPRIDPDSFEPLVAQTKAFTTFGIDVGLPIPLGESATLVPYFDFNRISVVQNGLGLHLGTMLKLHVARGLDNPFMALFRAEFRHVSGDYVGPYFNTVYEIERYQRLYTADSSQSAAARQPKLRDLCGSADCDDPAAARNGLWLEALLGLRNVFSVGVEYLAYDGSRGDGSFRLFAELPYFDWVQLKAFYFRYNTRGLSDIFGWDDNTALMAEVRIPFLYVLSGNFRWIRTFQARPEDQGFEPVDDWNVGLGVFVRL